MSDDSSTTTAQDSAAVPTEPPGHGMSVAAWVACGGIILGTLVSALGFVLAPYERSGGIAVAVIGGVVIVASALLGPVLVRAGYGEHSTNREYTGGPRAVR